MLPFLSLFRGQEMEGALQLLNLGGLFFFPICCRGFMKFLESTKGCRPGVLVRQVQTVSFCIHSLLAFHWHKGYTTFRAVEGWPETAMAVGAFLQVLARQQQYLDTYQSEVCFWADSNHIFLSWIYPAVGNGTLWSSSLKYEEKR